MLINCQSLIRMLPGNGTRRLPAASLLKSYVHHRMFSLKLRQSSGRAFRQAPYTHAVLERTARFSAGEMTIIVNWMLRAAPSER